MGKMTDMVMEFKYGQMGQSMKDSGTITKLKAKEPFGMLKVMFMMVNLKMIKQMGMGFIHILMDQGTKDTGEMICKKAKVLKYGVTELSTQEIIKRVKSMGMGYISG